MKRKLLLFLLSFPLLTYSQEVGKAVYEYEVLKSNIDDNLKGLLNLNNIEKDIEQGNLNKLLEVYFDKKRAVSYGDMDAEPGAKGNIPLIFMGLSDDFYTEAESKAVYNADVYEYNEVVVETTFADLGWKLEKETKTVDGRTLFKAVRKIKVRKNTFESVVWYDPSVPYHYGPQENVGLPGLVVEVEPKTGKQLLEYRIRLKELDFSDKYKNKIKSKPNLKKVSKAQMDEFYAKRTQEAVDRQRE